MFTGVRVFSASQPQYRAALGELVTAWLREQQKNPTFVLVELETRQSSDATHHLLTIIAFFKHAGAPRIDHIVRPTPDSLRASTMAELAELQGFRS